jgi:hypothetical protein
MEAYTAYPRSLYPGSLAEGAAALSVEGNERAMNEARRRLAGAGQGPVGDGTGQAE